MRCSASRISSSPSSPSSTDNGPRYAAKAAVLRIGNLLNQSELGRDVQLPAMPVHRYLNLLETSYQIVRLEP